MIDKAREVTLKILYKIDRYGAYSNIALDEEIKANNKILNERDIRFISQIVYGTTNWKLTIDTLIQQYSKIKIKKISPWIMNILRMGIYQIVFLDKIPKSAAVDESVNLAKKYGHPKSVGFVNAILRKIDKSSYDELFKIKNEKTKISKTQSMPIWIIEELMKEYNNKEVEQICKDFNQKPCISIRVNRLKTSREELIKLLENKGIKCKEAELEDFIIVENIKNIEGIEEFKKGYFTVQDQSAGLAVITLNPQKGEKILDACSAPGGKTTYIAEKMENCGEIDAWDIHEHRLKLIEENYNRLELSIIKTKKRDATKTIYNEKTEYDKILLDVPCLGIGVIKRKPDIKWKKNYEDIKEIIKTQLQILQNCSKLVKKGGEIVYSTCSILKEENINVINEFLKTNTNFESVEVKKILPNQTQDGFFICKLKKKY